MSTHQHSDNTNSDHRPALETELGLETVSLSASTLNQPQDVQQLEHPRTASLEPVDSMPARFYEEAKHEEANREEANHGEAKHEEANLVGMVLLRSDGQIQACNPAAEKILGFSLAQMQGCQYINCPWQIIRADGSPFPQEAHPSLIALQEGRSVVEQVIGLYQPDGTLVWLQVEAHPLFQQESSAPWAVMTTFSPIAKPTDDSHDARVQAELRQSEAKFRRLTDVSMFGVAIGDFDGKMLYANNALLNMIGYSRAELEAGEIRWIDLTPPEYLHLDWQAAEELRQTGIGSPFKKEYIHKDGHRVPILIGGALLNEPHAEQELIIGFYLDLSELQRTENSLQAALQRLNSHVENTPMAVVEWDANFVIRRWSGAAPQLFGWRAEEVLGVQMYDLNIIYEEDLAAVTETARRILSGVEPQVVSHNRNYTKDGSVLHCMWYSSTLTNLKGQVTSIMSLVLNVTDQVEATTALQQSEERFRLAARAVAGMVYDWNVQTGEVYRSEGIFDLLGIHPEAVPPTSGWWLEQIHPDDLEQLSPEFCSQQSNSYSVEYRVRHQDGRWIHVWDRGYLIRDRQGKIIRVVGSSTDITARKQIEQEREQLLHREQIAREQAEAVSRMKDEFLAAISHELRTPLNPILGWSKLLQTHPLDPEKLTQGLVTIERNAKLQAQLVEDLLDISRIMQAQLSLNTAAVDLETVIWTTLNTVQPAAEAKAITLKTSLDSILTPIMGDAVRLQQVLWNLLSNAIKFTPAGGQVEVRLERITEERITEEMQSRQELGQGSPHAQIPTLDTPRSYVQITVRDTGIGISPDFLPHIFEYFRQQDGATTRRFGGLGLGLTIVRQIVELHGGTIDADSAGIGQGATFRVRFPLLHQNAKSLKEEDSSTSEDSAWVSSTPHSLAGLEILVVEDNEDSRDYLAFVLEQAEARVMVADSAPAALEILSHTRPDMLLSDIGMPQMNGYELIQQIRHQLNLNPDQLPAIALTAYVQEFDQQQVIEAGFQQHLAKPVEPNALVNAIVTLRSSS
ncbi:MAG: PAS domain S-box protein [Oculatellaceae cyanobacterium Prado106]|jgi:PAS domain S-box-containing protein|nr:PAS domain S-box protein [Oculatellaceae cyanobacterium Prado106]